MGSLATLDSNAFASNVLAQLAEAGPHAAAERAVQQSKALNRFLCGIERRAFRIAQIGLRDRDEAMDVVQGAMLRLARSYGARPEQEWKPLFYRILQNGIRDAQRRRSVRGRLFGWRPAADHGEDAEAQDPFESVADLKPEASVQLMAGEAIGRLEQALQDLPARQQQAFVFRCLEEMDVAQTAAAMGCSQGSVKTHYFRALQALRARIGDAW